MTRFYIVFFPPKSAISHTIFRNFNIYTCYNYTYYATAIRPANYSYMVLNWSTTW